MSWERVRKLLRVDVDNREASEKAADWYDNLNHLQKASGAAVKLEHARDQLAASQSHFELLDNKLESLLKQSTTLLALSIGAARLLQLSGSELWWVVPSAVLLSLSIVYALVGRAPVSKPIPIATADLVDEELDEESLQVLIAGAIHTCVVDIGTILQLKGRCATIAGGLMGLGTMLLPLILVAA